MSARTYCSPVNHTPHQVQLFVPVSLQQAGGHSHPRFYISATSVVYLRAPLSVVPSQEAALGQMQQNASLTGKLFKSTNRWRMVTAALFVFHLTFIITGFLQGLVAFTFFLNAYSDVFFTQLHMQWSLFPFLDERIASQSHQNRDSESALDADSSLLPECLSAPHQWTIMHQYRFRRPSYFHQTQTQGYELATSWLQKNRSLFKNMTTKNLSQIQSIF